MGGEGKTAGYLGMELSLGRTWVSVPLSRSIPAEDDWSQRLGHKRPYEPAFCRQRLNSPVAGSEPVPPTQVGGFHQQKLLQSNEGDEKQLLTCPGHLQLTRVPSAVFLQVPLTSEKAVPVCGAGE